VPGQNLAEKGEHLLIGKALAAGDDDPSHLEKSFGIDDRLERGVAANPFVLGVVDMRNRNSDCQAGWEGGGVVPSGRTGRQQVRKCRL